MKVEVYKGAQGKHNLKSYEETCNTFDWKDVEQTFSWSETGEMNMAYKCIDRHVNQGLEDKVALNYKGGHRKESYTYKDMQRLSNKAANVLSEHAEVDKGDRAFMFMLRAPELYLALLGVLKIDAIVGSLFEAFIEKAVANRLGNSEAKVLITNKALLPRVSVDRLPNLKKIVVVDEDVEDNYINFISLMGTTNDEFDIGWLKSNDGLTLHYTSSSIRQPKGVLHVQQVMLVHYISGKYVLDLQEDDVYWCTAGPGWVTRTSYGTFTLWLNGATNCIAGGRFSPEQWCSMIEDFKMTIWYTAPAALRVLVGAGDDIVEKCDLPSLCSILSVDEPLNPEVIKWAKKVYGLTVLDAWWMTETGGHMIVSYPTVNVKLGSMGKPLSGIQAVTVNNAGSELPLNRIGSLAIKKGWPSMMYHIWKSPEKYRSYFIGDQYVSGDSAYKDEDGYFWFQGRVGGVIMTTDERIGPFGVKSKLVEHETIAEIGIIGKPDPVHDEIIKAFVTLGKGYEPTDELKGEIHIFVKEGLSVHATPREIEFKDELPETRSGKTMRRILEAWELNLDVRDLGTMEW